MKKLIKYNLKLIFSYNVAAAILLVIVLPIFFPLKRQQFYQLAKIGELYLSITGILLFVFLGKFEKNRNTWEVVYSKKISYLRICLFRVFVMLIVNAILILIPVLYISIQSPEITILQGYFGFLLTSYFLGLLGLLITELTGDYKAGYIVSFAYYFLGTASKEIFTKFQVFGYTKGNMDSKSEVMWACIFMLILYFFLIERECRGKWK